MNDQKLTVGKLKNILEDAKISDDMPITVCMNDTGVFYLTNLALLHCNFEEDKNTLCFYANNSENKARTIEYDTSLCKDIIWKEKH